MRTLFLWIAVCWSSLLSAQKIVTLECRVSDRIFLNQEKKNTRYEVNKGNCRKKPGDVMEKTVISPFAFNPLILDFI